MDVVIHLLKVDHIYQRSEEENVFMDNCQILISHIIYKNKKPGENVTC